MSASRHQAGRLEALMKDLLRRLYVYDPEDPGLELPVTQLRVLTLLSRVPHTLTGLAGEMGCSVSAATQIADRLESASLVERVPDPADRRCKHLQLTPRGQEVVRRRSERRLARAADALERLAPAEREAALAALERLLEAARELPFGTPEVRP